MSQQQWVFTCALGRHDFLFLSQGSLCSLRERGLDRRSQALRPFLPEQMSPAPSPPYGSFSWIPGGDFGKSLCPSSLSILGSQGFYTVMLAQIWPFKQFFKIFADFFLPAYNGGQRFFLPCCATGEPVYMSHLYLERSVPPWNASYLAPLSHQLSDRASKIYNFVIYRPFLFEWGVTPFPDTHIIGRSRTPEWFHFEM